MVERSERIEGRSKRFRNGRRVHKRAYFFLYLQITWVTDERSFRKLCLPEDIWERNGKTKEKIVWCRKGKTNKFVWALLRLSSRPEGHLVYSWQKGTSRRIFGGNLSTYPVSDLESKWKSCPSKMLLITVS